MSLDFTLQKYSELCEAIAENYVPICISKYLETSPKECIILRHDVDRKPNQAWETALIEHEHGITSTYYFRMTEEVFQPHIIKKIAELGYEIGYHYEVLDKTNGDINKAIELFEQELNEFRAFVDIKTVCMHGNPLNPWYNRDLWQDYDFHDFGIIGEPYLSIDYSKVHYFTDVGRRWDGKYSIKDKGGNDFFRIRNTDDLINLIKNGEVERACIATHPNRWNDDFISWSKELIFQNIKNLGKAGILFYRKKRNSSRGRLIC